MRKLLTHVHPGEIPFEKFVQPMDISINGLACEFGAPANRVSEIVNGRRGSSAGTALRPGLFFNVSAETWLGLQSEYDLRMARVIQARKLKSGCALT